MIYPLPTFSLLPRVWKNGGHVSPFPYSLSCHVYGRMAAMLSLPPILSAATCMEEWRPCYPFPPFSQLTRVWKNGGHFTPSSLFFSCFFNKAAFLFTSSIQGTNKLLTPILSQQETVRMAKSFYFYAKTLKLIAELSKLHNLTC